MNKFIISDQSIQRNYYYKKQIIDNFETIPFMKFNI